MDKIILEVAVAIIGAITAPILFLLRRQQQRQQKVDNRIEHIEKEITELDKAQAVQNVQLNDIKQDIHQINKKLDKIIDKLVE